MIARGLGELAAPALLLNPVGRMIWRWMHSLGTILERPRAREHRAAAQAVSLEQTRPRMSLPALGREARRGAEKPKAQMLGLPPRSGVFVAAVAVISRGIVPPR